MVDKTNLKIWLAAAVILLGLAPAIAAGGVIYVDVNTPDNNDGSSWGKAYKYLQDAMAVAEDGNDVWVAEGIYRPDANSAEPNGTGDRTATFGLINGVALYGGFAGGESSIDERDWQTNETILSGDLSNNDGPGFMNNDENSYHVVTGSGTGATAVLDGVTITAGNADRGGPPHCFGGGMYSASGSPTVTNCTFTSNYSLNGGGMYNNSSSSTITNCIFCGNSAGDGGAMLNDESNLVLVNCLFSGNSAGVTGGGMYDGHSNTTLVNCTFSQNSSNTWGGAIHGAFTEPTLTNCILWGNTAERGSQISMKYWSVVSVSYSDVQGGRSQIYLYKSSVNWGDGNIDDDPLFLNPEGVDNMPGTEDDNLRLLGGSPCLDSGDNNSVPPDNADLDGDGNTTEPLPFDLDGNPRVHNGRVDMGAYEGPKGGFLLSTKSVTVPEGGTGTFTVALPVEPLGTVEVAVTHESGDPDITVQSGELLIFDPCNYSDPQTVTLAAAEDADHIHGQALIVVNAEGLSTVGVTATEEDNEPNTNILFVDAGASGASNGSSWVDAFTDLQEALSTAAVFPQFEQILIAQGLYRPAEPGGDRFASFQLVNGVALYGGFPSGGGQWKDRDPNIYETTLSGDLNGDDAGFANYDENSYHVVNSSGTDETTIIDGFTITGGNANGAHRYNSGGGIYNEGGEFSGCTPIISNCRISGNWAYYGGGMLNYYMGIVIIGAGGPGPTLTNCVFSGNAAGVDGGTIYNDSSNPIVTNCTISGNSAAQDGGAIFNEGSCPPLTDCTLSGNSAGRNGGAVLNLDCLAPILTNCTLRENSAGYHGGGLYSWMSNPLLTNCIFNNNSAEFCGGGMVNDESCTTLINCTLSTNQGADGGGIYNYYSYFELTNSILWGNSDGGGADESAQIEGIYNIPPVVNYCCVQGWTGGLGGTGNIGDDPCFVDPNGPDDTVGTEDDNLRLSAGSPCIDASDNDAVSSSVTTDLDGLPRFIDELCTIDTGNGTPPIVDMGAYEFLRSDIDSNGSVDFEDYCVIAERWPETSCGLCGGADLTCDGNVDWNDVREFAENWLAGK